MQIELQRTSGSAMSWQKVKLSELGFIIIIMFYFETKREKQNRHCERKAAEHMSCNICNKIINVISAKKIDQADRHEYESSQKWRRQFKLTPDLSKKYTW